MNESMWLIRDKLEKLPHDWSIERTQQIFEPEPGLWERLELAAGRFFIATGEKLVRASKLPPRLEKKAI